MMRLQITPRAQSDLDAIFAYIATDRPAVAAKVLDFIEARFHTLAMYPEVGERLDEWLPGLRRFSAGSYVIYFRNSATHVAILRVLHGAMDAEAEF